jgi:hypothetical protein
MEEDLTYKTEKESIRKEGHMSFKTIKCPESLSAGDSQITQTKTEITIIAPISESSKNLVHEEIGSKLGIGPKLGRHALEAGDAAGIKKAVSVKKTLDEIDGFTKKNPDSNCLKMSMMLKDYEKEEIAKNVSSISKNKFPQLLGSSSDDELSRSRSSSEESTGSPTQTFYERNRTFCDNVGAFGKDYVLRPLSHVTIIPSRVKYWWNN